MITRALLRRLSLWSVFRDLIFGYALAIVVTALVVIVVYFAAASLEKIPSHTSVTITPSSPAGSRNNNIVITGVNPDGTVHTNNLASLEPALDVASVDGPIILILAGAAMVVSAYWQLRTR